MAGKRFQIKRRHFLSGLFILVLFLVGYFFHAEKIEPSDRHPIIVYDKIGFVTDIHAASQDVRAMESNPDNVVYPSKYKEAVDTMLRKMKNEGVALAISLGDTTNDGSVKHAQNIRWIAQGDGMDMLFVKGNHDRDEKEKDAAEDKAEGLSDEKKLSEILDLSNPYYYVDRQDWRIIVLDSNEIPSASVLGGIENEQLDWLEKALDTDRWVLIAMHHPIWSRANRDVLNGVYERFYNIIKKSNNVRYVLSGHEHVFEWEKKDGITWFYGLPALTLKGKEGYYRTIGLESYVYED